MKAVRNAMRNFSVTGELLSFFSSKRWWLLPMLFSLFVLAALILLAQSSTIAPFIYTLF
jgi:Family of unknown function (DUF5989)